MKKIFSFMFCLILALGCTNVHNTWASETQLPEVGVTITYNSEVAQLNYPRALPDLDYAIAGLSYTSDLMKKTEVLPIIEFDSAGNYFSVTNTRNTEITVDIIPTYTFDEQGYNKIFYREQQGKSTTLTLGVGQSGEVQCTDLANMENGRLTFPTIVALAITVKAPGATESQKTDTAFLVIPKGYTLTQEELEKIGLRSESLNNVGSSSTVQENTPQNNSSVKVVFNGQPLQFDLPIINKEGRSFYPFRPLIEGIGGTVDWDSVNSKAIAKLNGNTVEFTIGWSSYQINGVWQWEVLDVVPFIEAGRTYIPIREACEGLGFSVGWDGATQTITIDS